MRNLITVDGVDGAGSTSITAQLLINIKTATRIYVPYQGKTTTARQKLKQYQKDHNLSDADTDPEINRGYFEIVQEVYLHKVTPLLNANQTVVVESGDIKSAMHAAADNNLSRFAEELHHFTYTANHIPYLRVLVTAPPKKIVQVMLSRQLSHALTTHDPKPNLASAKRRIDNFNQVLHFISFEKQLGVKHIIINNDRSQTLEQITAHVLSNF